MAKQNQNSTPAPANGGNAGNKPPAAPPAAPAPQNPTPGNGGATGTALARIGGGAAGAIQRTDATNYAIVMMATAGAGDVSDALRENLGGTNLSAFDFQRVKVPAGGGIAWELTDGDTGEVTAAPAFEGIIVSFNDQKAYWAQGLDEQGAVQGPPQCYSTDTIKGIGNPGVMCAQCPFNVFGTAKKNTARGKACKDVRLLFVCRPGDVLPELVPVPPTSIKNVKNYFLRLAGRGIPYWKAVTRFKLVKDKNSAGIAYAKIDPELVGVVDDDSAPHVRGYSETIRAMLGKATVQVRDTDLRVEDMRGGAADSQRAHGAGSGEPVDVDVIPDEGEGDVDRSEQV